MIRIRPAGPDDGPAIARIRAETWRVAYAGVLPARVLADMTAPATVAREGELRSAHPMDGFLIAESCEAGSGDGSPSDVAQPAGETDGEPGRGGTGCAQPGLIGFAAYGPERGEEDEPGRPGGDSGDHGPAELYAIYVVPSQWSTGAGRTLLESVLALAAQDGYSDISLWVLEANARARRFYEIAGFALTGESAILARLDGVMQVRYRRLLG